MNRFKAIIGAVGALAWAVSALAAEPPPLKIGVAKIDITPKDLTGLDPMGGSFTGVHDPIYLRALLLDNGKTRAAIVTGDLIEAGDTMPVRKRIQAELGIPADHVIITATHDHSAPRIGDVSPGALAHPGGPESQAYTRFVFDRIVEALKTAKAAEQPARFGSASGSVDVNVNRDEYTANGWRIGYNPDGPSDKTVQVVKFETLDGKPLAVLFNYAVHANVTLGIKEISGDLSGAAERYVEDSTSAVALWTLGAVGDQAPRLFHGGQKGTNEKDRALAYQAAEAQGVMVGAEVVRVANLITPATATARIEADERILTCPAKEGTDQMADMKQEKVSTVQLHLSLILLDQIAFAGVSGEVVTNIYWHLKRDSPLAKTILISIANDRVGYLPDDAAFDRPIFEVNGSPVARGCAETGIVDGITGMIRQHL